MRDEPGASIVAEALEGYAAGRFATQSEVARFLQNRPEFPKSPSTGEVRITKVTEMLQRATYAGYVEAPNWDVSFRRGRHEPLISFATHERIQERLAGTAVASARKDLNLDFPLRRFVLCDDCGKPMTSCWSKGRNKAYPYSLCDTRGCASFRKLVRRLDSESGAEEFLKRLQPKRNLSRMTRAMLNFAWDQRRAQAKAEKQTLMAQRDVVEKKIETLVDRIVEAPSASLVRAYEERLAKLEREKIRLGEQAAEKMPEPGRQDEMIEHTLEFLASP